MRFRSGVAGLALAAVLAAAGGVGRASADPISYDYTFTIGGFSEGASATFSFNGSDGDGDGLVSGYYMPDALPADLPTYAQEITALSISFSGNSLLPAFAGSTSDFSDLLQTLSFPAGSSYAFQLIYVVDPSLPTGPDLTLPPGTAAGDGMVFLAGEVPQGVGLIYGSSCAAFGGQGLFADTGMCAIAQLNTVETTFQDVALMVPEPASLALLAGMVGVLGVTRRRRA